MTVQIVSIVMLGYIYAVYNAINGHTDIQTK